MMIRSFFAIPLSTKINDRIFVEMSKVKNLLLGAPIKWVEPQNLHLTIKFLGNSTIKDLNTIVDHVQKEIQFFKDFQLSFHSFGAYPSVKNPKVIWVGCDSNEQLQRLFKIIEDISSNFNIPCEERLFSPHITLGRVKNIFTKEESEVFTKTISQLRTIKFGTQDVNGFSLIRSDLRPSGPIYTPIYKFMFSVQSSLV